MRVLTADQQRVKDLVAVFNTPIVFHPGGWDDTLPEWLRTRVIKERVEMVCNGGWDKATDAEVTCYLYTASLSQPLGSDWTAITLYQAAKQIPQLREVSPATPKELSDYQKSKLEDLKRKIRNSQLKRHNKSKKEEIKPMRKIVIDEKESKVLMGVMKDNADPVIKTVEGTLESALGGIPQLLADAEAEWAKSLKRPTYKAPPEPKKETKPAVSQPAAGKPTEDLPLLSGTEPKAPAGETKAPEPETEAPAGAPEPETEAPVGETPAAEKPAEVVETKVEEKAAPVAPAIHRPAAKTSPEAMGIHVPDDGNMVEASEPVTTEAAPAVPAAATPTPSPASQATPAVPSGEWEYWLEDGRGPYNTVQEAMDAKAMDKANRPQHNRWDRLSTELKKAIQRKPKAG